MIPAFADLPTHPELGLKHSWEVFGSQDDLGTLNHLTPSRVAAAAAEVRTGESFGLSLGLQAIDPPLFGREPLKQSVFATSRNDWDEKLDNVFPQAGTQWDGLLHVRAREHGFYTGVTDDPPASGRLGISAWRGVLAGRGVLLDLGAHLGLDALAGHPVSAQQVQDCADAQGVTVQPGDFLCLRFGWTSAYRRLCAAERTDYATPGRTTFTGLAGTELMSQVLWDWGVSALVCDNPAAEVAPGDPGVGSLHRRLLPMLGMPIGELFDLDALAEACRADGRWSFLLIAAPHQLAGSVASPGNAVGLR